jgi:hypothetical protein
MTQISRSTRQATTVPGGVQKRRTLIISDRDPRNNPSYIANYIGEIKVLPYEKYVQYIKTSFYSDVEELIQESENVVEGLRAPTNLYWDPTDSNSSEIIPSGLTHTINLYVTFDPSVDEIADNGEVTYQVRAVATGPAITQAVIDNGGGVSTGVSGSKVSPSGTSQFTPITRSTIVVVTKTSSQIKLKWKGVPGATGYDVVVTGKNQPAAVGKASKAYSSGNNLNTDGYHYFTIIPQTVYVFSGPYNFSIKVKYNKGVSKAVTYNGQVNI